RASRPVECRRVTRLSRFLCIVAAAEACAVGMAVLVAGAQDASIWRGVYTAAQAERGKAVYMRQCSRCHGEDLGGRRDYPLSCERFMERWEAHTLDHLVVLIRTSMPPDGIGTVAADDTRDIV